MAATVAELADDELQALVPATPEWRVRDVLAHVVGLAADLNAQRFPAADDAGGSAWAAQQVVARRDLAVAAIVAEWVREAPVFEAGLRFFGYEEGSHFVADLHAHHQDVRGALGLSRDDDPLTVAVALDHYLGFLDQLLLAAQWGTLEVVAGNEARLVGGAGVPRRRERLGVRRVAQLLRGVRQRRSAHSSGTATQTERSNCCSWASPVATRCRRPT